ncbi:MAG: helix-turn-helix domain-containing protein [Candidatus Omnitrophica bacterium]|nr:helix-turn-helix domain-containing protein [Candidatus Omnitrophota bacterium]
MPYDLPKQPNQDRPQIMTPKETAQYLGVHLMTVYRLIHKGELPGFKIGGQWRIKKDVLDTWILDQTPRKAEKRDPVEGDDRQSTDAG